MYILSQNREVFYEMGDVNLHVDKETGAVLILGEGDVLVGSSTILGAYAEYDTAVEVMEDICDCMSTGAKAYKMPAAV